VVASQCFAVVAVGQGHVVNVGRSGSVDLQAGEIEGSRTAVLGDVDVVAVYIEVL
jgi:hypothetical protein